MQLAAQAVAKPQQLETSWAVRVALPHNDQSLSLSEASEGSPGFSGLGLVIEARHIAPGMDPPAAAGQGLEQASVAELRSGGEVTASDEFD
jgi:hypothetical protein